MKKQNGFTFLEILLVIGIMAIIAGASVPLYNNLYSGTRLREARDLAAQTIDIAREKSIASDNDFAHGIYFEVNASVNDKIITYTGDSYDTRVEENDEEYIFDQVISLSVGFLPTEINFSTTTGEVDNFGEIEFSLEGTSRTKVLRVNKYGIVY